MDSVETTPLIENILAVIKYERGYSAMLLRVLNAVFYYGAEIGEDQFYAEIDRLGQESLITIVPFNWRKSQARRWQERYRITEKGLALLEQLGRPYFFRNN